MEINTDVLIIGSGIAGLYAALKVDENFRVILVTKKNSAESNTNLAQGGIASVIDPKDSYERHIEDTLIAGAGLCKKEAVEILVTEGPERIRDLMKIGAHFTFKDGKLDLAKEGGHSAHRIVHAADLTGREVERALLEAISSRKNIEMMENHIAIDLITEHNVFHLKEQEIKNRHCWGAYVLDAKSGVVKTIKAQKTLLATGGLGQVYLHTTNPLIATGDGFAMAYRAGAKIGNMEFIQFHPTSFYSSSDYSNVTKPSFLISEAVRGFGGILRTKDGQEFMHKYDSRKELAPRDIVARAIDNELKKRGDEFVYLDITHKDKEQIKEHFPHIFKNCLEAGIDITKEYIPVVPAAHYACGGIVVDTCGRASLKNLYACGEVTMTGVHGANRLASNSLLEALVYSFRAASDMNSLIGKEAREMPQIPSWDDSGTLTADEKIMITHSVKEVKQVMWDYVGIVRSDLRLDRAFHRIHNLYLEIENMYKKTKVFESILELRNLITCSHMIIKSAKMRKESRGLHYTLDYLKPSEEIHDTIIQNRIL
ncbi:MAG: L-aspartate oxidase [Ignavibacteria bacterium]|jgi:L-aspartate oxidase|nr:L-aspartate oxidase [Ignavibacteria bacterium]MCU7501526.1 L-aspartate oxidase [Ignavibacteria bacterium]MCU7515958.1 L-aspartate oxidase [Ignavibacteria bacterium]